MGFNLYDLATDPELENNGVDIELVPGLTAGIRSHHSDAVRYANQRIAKRNAAYGTSALPTAVLDQNEADLATVICVRWNLCNAKGEPIPCTPEMKRSIFDDPKNWEFRQLCIGASYNNSNFRMLKPAAAVAESDG